jgi:thioredoxin 1
VAAVLAGVVLVLVGGGCGASKFTRINETVSDFHKQVLQADQPVLVEFYKGGCPTCGLLEPTLNQLFDEYSGRMKFICFELMRPYFAVSCPEVQKKQRIAYYPTVILYVKGEEKKRWIIDYGIDNYRAVLNETVGGPAVAEKPDAPRPDASQPQVSRPDVWQPDADLFDLEKCLGQS